MGLKYGTMQHRRRHHPAFAARWDAELVCAQARLARRRPSTGSGRARTVGANPSTALRAVPLPEQAQGGAYRTLGGETVVIRLKSGKLQGGGLTRESSLRRLSRRFWPRLASPATS